MYGYDFFMQCMVMKLKKLLIIIFHAAVQLHKQR